MFFSLMLLFHFVNPAPPKIKVQREPMISSYDLVRALRQAEAQR